MMRAGSLMPSLKAKMSRPSATVPPSAPVMMAGGVPAGSPDCRGGPGSPGPVPPAPGSGGEGLAYTPPSPVMESWNVSVRGVPSGLRTAPS